MIPILNMIANAARSLANTIEASNKWGDLESAKSVDQVMEALPYRATRLMEQALDGARYEGEEKVRKEFADQI